MHICATRTFCTNFFYFFVVYLFHFQLCILFSARCVYLFYILTKLKNSISEFSHFDEHRHHHSSSSSSSSSPSWCSISEYGSYFLFLFCSIVDCHCCCSFTPFLLIFVVPFYVLCTMCTISHSMCMKVSIWVCNRVYLFTNTSLCLFLFFIVSDTLCVSLFLSFFLSFHLN